MWKKTWILAKDACVYYALAYTAYSWITMIPQNKIDD